MRGPLMAWLLTLWLLGLSGCPAGDPPLITRLIDGRPQMSAFVSPSAYAAYLRARLALQRGQPELCVYELNQALAFDASSPHLHTQMAMVLARLGEMKPALEHLRLALSLHPGHAGALRLLAQIRFKQGQPAAAEQDLRRCLAENPTDEPCALTWVALLERQGRLAEAQALLDGFLRKTTGSWEARLRTAQLCLRRLDYACAARELPKALARRFDPETASILVRVLLALDRRAEALAQARRLFDRTGGTPRAADLLLFLLAQGPPDALSDHLQVLDRELAWHPGRLEHLARLYLGRRLFAQAQRILMADGTAATCPVAQAPLCARTLHGLGRLDEAQALLAPLAAASGPPEVIVELARLKSAAGQPAEAETLLRGALARDPDSDALRIALAHTLCEQGKPAQAVALLDPRIRGHEASQALIVALSLALEKSGRWTDAAALLDRELKRHPRDALLLNHRGYLELTHHGDLRKAEAVLLRAAALEPASGPILDSLGWLRFKQGRKTEALDLLRMAHRLSPDDDEIKGHLAEAEAALGSGPGKK